MGSILVYGVAELLFWRMSSKLMKNHKKSLCLLVTVAMSLCICLKTDPYLCEWGNWVWDYTINCHCSESQYNFHSNCFFMLKKNLFMYIICSVSNVLCVVFHLVFLMALCNNIFILPTRKWITLLMVAC